MLPNIFITIKTAPIRCYFYCNYILYRYTAHMIPTLFENRTAIQGPISFSAVQHTVFSLPSTADFLSTLFLAVTHRFFPAFSSGFYINSYSRCHFLALARSMIYFYLKLARPLDAVLNKYTIYDSRNLSSYIAKNPSAAASAASKGSLFMFFYD